MRFVSRVRRRLFGEPLPYCRLTLLERMPKGSICAEIGVYKGDFSEHILNVVRPKQLHLIDPWYYETGAKYQHTWHGGKVGVNQAHMDELYESVERRFRKEISAGTVVIHRASSSVALNNFPIAFFDWVYIDGNHLYDFVRADIELSLRVVRPGGLIAGDDYHMNGWWGDGVIRAVDEAREICSTRLILDGQFILQKPNVADNPASSAKTSHASVANASRI